MNETHSKYIVEWHKNSILIEVFQHTEVKNVSKTDVFFLAYPKMSF